MLRPYVSSCVCHVRNQSLTVYIKVYMQVFLHIYSNIYVQVAHNLASFYATKLKISIIVTQIKILDFMADLRLGLAPKWGLESECIKGHIEHMQNGNRIMWYHYLP